MAQTAVVLQPTRIVHSRGTWSAREDRIASAVWLGIFWVGIIAGFGTDFSRYLHQTPAPAKILHVHAVIFSVWLLIFTAQVLLVVGDRVAWHRQLGWLAAGWACLMAVVGPWAALSKLAQDSEFVAFLSVNIVDLGGFLVLLVWGLTLRTNPAAHRRVMMLSLIAMADPGFSRFSGYVIPNEPKTVLPWFVWTFYGNVLLIALMAYWDWRRGRLMRQFVIGASGLLAALFGASWLYFWPPWKQLALTLVQAWARLGL